MVNWKRRRNAIKGLEVERVRCVEPIVVKKGNKRLLSKKIEEDGSLQVLLEGEHSKRLKKRIILCLPRCS